MFIDKNDWPIHQWPYIRYNCIHIFHGDKLKLSHPCISCICILIYYVDSKMLCYTVGKYIFVHHADKMLHHHIPYRMAWFFRGHNFYFYILFDFVRVLALDFYERCDIKEEMCLTF